MGYALMWVEGLAVALFAVAWTTAWAARGRAARSLAAALTFLFFGAAAAVAVWATYQARAQSPLVRTSWFWYTLTWLTAFGVGGVGLLRTGHRRPDPGLGRRAAAWPAGTLGLGLGGALLALGFTFWNLDLTVRADLAIARQEAAGLLHDIAPAPVADTENAARVYAQAVKDLGQPVPDSLTDAVRRGLDARRPVDWKSSEIAELVRRHEPALALLRKAAAMPRCVFDQPRGLLDAVGQTDPIVFRLRTTGVPLLALDARQRAGEGNLARAFEDVSAILAVVRHTGAVDTFVGPEDTAWRTLEEVLHLAPAGTEPLPPLAVPEPTPLVRKTREAHALLGLVLPVAASEPALVWESLVKDNGSWFAAVMTYVVAPAARVFIIPDELTARRKLLDDFRKAPRAAADESPRDWAATLHAVQNDPTSIYSVVYVKPKEQVLLANALYLAGLRQTARTGLAVASYRRKHGRYPERLEQLVPEFLPAVPVDPRDGQPLQLRRVGATLVVHAPADAAAVDAGKLRDPDERFPAPIFRLDAASSH